VCVEAGLCEIWSQLLFVACIRLIIFFMSLLYQSNNAIVTVLLELLTALHNSIPQNVVKDGLLAPKY